MCALQVTSRAKDATSVHLLKDPLLGDSKVDSSGSFRKKGTKKMPPSSPDPVALLNALQGRWIPVYQEIDGQMLPAAANTLTMELQGDEFRIEKDGGVAYEGTFTTQGQSLPLSIALIYKTSAQPLFLGGPRPGVFQIEGDTLKLCLGAIDKPPPSALATFPGSEAILSIFQRNPKRGQLAALQHSMLRSVIAW